MELLPLPPFPPGKLLGEDADLEVMEVVAAEGERRRCFAGAVGALLLRDGLWPWSADEVV